MNKMQQQVAEFMRDVKGLTLPNKPIIRKTEVANLCYSLIEEEHWELSANLTLDREYGEYYDPARSARIADDLADLLYVVFYTCNAYGIDIEPIFDEVHRSNMTKKGGAKREDGKQLKPPGYEPPDLEPLIKEQMGVWQ